MSSGDFIDSPKLYYRQLYYEAINNTSNCLQNRFHQPGYKMYCKLEELLINASTGKDITAPFEFVCSFYKDDLEENILRGQLQVFGTKFQSTYREKFGTNVLPTILGIRDYFQSMNCSQRSLLSQVTRVLQLLLVMPSTNATSERSFSALRRVKTYLRSTMSQERLNNLLVLHVHKDRTASLDICFKLLIALLVTLSIGLKYLVNSTKNMCYKFCDFIYLQLATVILLI